MQLEHTLSWLLDLHGPQILLGACSKLYLLLILVCVSHSCVLNIHLILKLTNYGFYL